MKKHLIVLLMPLLVGCSSSFYQARAEEDNSFIATSLTITDYNYNALQYRKSTRGINIKKADNMTSTDAYLRFDSIDQDHEVNVHANKYLAIRYRANYDPEFTLRIKSTTGSKNWSDFRFPDDKGHIENTVGTWNTYVYYLSFENSATITEEEYNAWEQGDYVGVSFNILNHDSFVLSSSYLYISSFAFFDNETAANNYSGLDYARNADTEGPIITVPYGDGDIFNTTAGKSFEFTADAYDAYDDIHSTVNGELSAGALDGEGKLVEGNHTVTFRASDLSNNETVKVLNLVVGPKDTVPPVINCNLTKIYVPVGTYNRLAFTAYDAEDGEIKCEYLYSANSVDDQNRFVKGDHTLTITATDLSGNVASKNISIIVSDDFNPNGLEVIEEEK